MTTTARPTSGIRLREWEPTTAFGRHLVESRGLSPATARCYEQSIERIKRFAGKDDPLTIAAEEVRLFLVSSKCHVKTKAHTLASLKHCIRWAAETGQGDLNDVLTIPPPDRNEIAGLGDLPRGARVRQVHKPNDELKARFADHLLYEDELSPRTVNVYVRRLSYAEELTGKAIEDIDVDDLRELKRQTIQGTIGLSRESVKGIFVAVKAFRRWGALLNLWQANDQISQLRPPRVARNKPQPLSPDECRMLLDSCLRPPDYKLVYCGLYLGTRIGESAALGEAMWMDDGFIRFVGEKNGQFREIPIHPDLEAVRWEVLASPPARYSSTLQASKRRLVDRTGIKFHSHQLRDTFATRLYDADVPDRIVKELLGHAHDVTGSYVEVSRRRKREAIATLAYYPDQ